MKQHTMDLAKVRAFGNIEFLARQLVEGFITGLHKSPFHGFSVEFAEHKRYNTGESTRNIDWKVMAKTDKLFVKRYEEETNLRCHILLDISSSMYYPIDTHGKITFSTLAAASLTYLLQKQKDAVGLCTFADDIKLQTPVKSTPSHAHTLMLELESIPNKVPERSSTQVASVLHQIAEKIHKRSLVIIFSDMFTQADQTDDLFSALQHLKHKLHEVLLFHVTDHKTEQDFAFENRPYEFIDLETGERIKLQADQVRSSYQKASKTYYEDLKLRCGQYKIDFIEADIDKGVEPILTAYLAKHSKMH
ncbi:uncharacterized protein DUF58 [Dyadobacter jejuensis]|uniref:Uncharacterized protein DUF58 n=1 Tax=Dyadobacter jejuensis TaxID=1082580 RepID=A0A316ASG5_9BACT|nr:DUF58 domain-containing protein [Dyadobacter jejuensis]PWJ60643.1 uncharacterized protein DUF58 [Dyadobacter jejuensis]